MLGKKKGMWLWVSICRACRGEQCYRPTAFGLAKLPPVGATRMGAMAQTRNTAVLITNGNPFVLMALSQWLPEAAESIQAVYVTPRLPGSAGNVRGGLRLLRRTGLRYTWFKVWVNRVLPIRARIAGGPASVGALLRRAGSRAPVRVVDSVNDPSVVADIAALSPDYLISVSAQERFRDPLLRTARIAAVNVHASPLPAYAGLSPNYWQLFNGEQGYACSLHLIVPQLDAGDILGTEEGSLVGITTVLEASLRMAGSSARLLGRFARGEIPADRGVPQDPSRRSYYGHPTRSQMREFHRRGLHMMDGESRRAAVEALLVSTRQAASPAADRSADDS